MIRLDWLGELTCRFLAKHGFVIYDKDDHESHDFGYNIIGLLTVGAIGGPLVLLWRLVEKIMAWLS